MVEKVNHLTVTPLGALYATSNAEDSTIKKVLIKMLTMKNSFLLNNENLLELTEVNDIKLAEAILYQLQVKHYVQAESEEVSVPNFNISEELPTYLRLLSSTGRAVLTDQNGFLISQTGFDDENVEEVSALSSQFTSIYQSYRTAISDLFGESYSSVGLINNQGISRLGFVILNIADEIFTLTIGDTPFLNQRTFRDIVWLLAYRYAGTVA